MPPDDTATCSIFAVRSGSPTWFASCNLARQFLNDKDAIAAGYAVASMIGRFVATPANPMRLFCAHRQSGIDGLCGKTRKMTGRENLDFARQTSSARVIVTMRLMGGPHGATSPARPNPCRIFLQGRLWPFKL